MNIVLGLIGVFLLCILVIVCRDSNRFHTVSYVVKTDKLRAPFHFVFLSDLHNKVYGREHERLIEEIDRLAPQAVLIGGDLLTARPGEDVRYALSLLERLHDRYPLYYANGNHEQRLALYPQTYGSMGTEYEERLGRLGIKRLVNEQSLLPDENIAIIGCEIDRKYYKRLCRMKMEDGYLEQLLPPRDGERFTILLAHNPDYFDEYVNWGADLIVSGHVHGGIARIPGIGGVISTNFKLFPRYDGGRFEKKASTMLVSRGLGSHTIPIRFLNPGELLEITIEPVTDGQVEN